MKKTYRAYGSVLSLGAFVHGRNIRLEFSPVSNYDGYGGSIYSTEDEELQRVMESRADFGTLFRLVDNNKFEEITEENGQPCTAESYEPKRELEVIKVESIADAKLWLMDNKGWKPASRVTKKGLIEAAEAYGVAFDGI